ncbi:MAG: hypothetical protein AAF648_17340 [Pseudomonadota bacterium]
MPTLVVAWRHNHRLVELHQDSSGQSIGVLLKSGAYRYVPWLGFIEVERAKRIGRPVRLKVDRVGMQGEFSTEWQDLAAQQHVLGCLVERGVYALADRWVQVV